MNRMIAMLALLAVMGCENMGLYDAGTADEARQQPPTSLVASVIQPAPTETEREVVVDGRLWIASGRPVALDPQDVRPIGSANGRTVHARTWDRPPYDELFTPGDDERRWLAYRPVIGGDVPAGTAQTSPEDEGPVTDDEVDGSAGPVDAQDPGDEGSAAQDAGDNAEGA